jgi:hypothetical protein
MKSSRQMFDFIGTVGNPTPTHIKHHCIKVLKRVVLCIGLVWFGLVWFGLVWFGLVWFGLVLSH